MAAGLKSTLLLLFFYNSIDIKLCINSHSKTILPSAAYCYEVEQYDESDPSASGQIGTAPFDRIRRPKGVYTRDKNRLFLKQFVEGGPGGIISIKVRKSYILNYMLLLCFTHGISCYCYMFENEEFLCNP